MNDRPALGENNQRKYNFYPGATVRKTPTSKQQEKQVVTMGVTDASTPNGSTNNQWGIPKKPH
ncbi:hypothetical protein J2T56_002237 [Natronobacillus azotifigens]|uniref:Uncharacterized protein n=1 Tax=Natronobacillus azotifigens TaxID=472978 RepID=A0A9J6RFW8_9BACI|nr:hypothetical protein [Natronobacillus azotifigens]MCZ0704049.1 hypothetical protein [Natronobacillus azotifigens]